MRVPNDPSLDQLMRMLNISDAGKIDQPYLLSETGKVYPFLDILAAILERLPDLPDHK